MNLPPKPSGRFKEHPQKRFRRTHGIKQVAPIITPIDHVVDRSPVLDS
jgi:hypothetical protein